MTGFCAISGESIASSTGVYCTKDQNIYKKEVLIKWLEENNSTSPFNNQIIIHPENDLFPLAPQSKHVFPRPPAINSIPATLLMLQNEWDALMLETFNLKTQFHTTQQELANTLYENDAAKRVIARLIKERDEARVALSEFKVQFVAKPSSSTGPSTKRAEEEIMDVDGQAAVLPREVADLVDTVSEELSSARRKRKAPETLATLDQLSEYKVVHEWNTINSAKEPAVSCMAISSTDKIIIGGIDGTLSLLQPPSPSSLPAFATATSKAHKKSITSVAWAGSDTFLSASLDGCVKVWSLESSTAKKDVGGVRIKGSGGGETLYQSGVANMSLHPSASFFASSGVDESEWALTDLSTFTQLTSTKTTSPLHTGAFHPDGILYAAASSTSAVLYDIKTSHPASSLDHPGLVDVAFSENGYHFATAGHTSVYFWDLRKLQVFHRIDGLDGVTGVRFDASGKYVGVSGSALFQMWAVKKWEIVKEVGVDVVDFVWGRDAKFVVSGGDGRRVCLFA